MVILLSERIVLDPEVLAGKPVIRGTRLAVGFILELLAAGQSENELLTNYPRLTREDILACLLYRKSGIFELARDIARDRPSAGMRFSRSQHVVEELSRVSCRSLPRIWGPRCSTAEESAR